MATFAMLVQYPYWARFNNDEYNIKTVLSYLKELISSDLIVKQRFDDDCLRYWEIRFDVSEEQKYQLFAEINNAIHYDKTQHKNGLEYCTLLMW